MPFPLYLVDAFTAVPFGGNQAAVCILSAVRDAAWMQHVAAEMNVAETAFLERRDEGFGLRWFTPTVEVDLCGHATLASAHALWENALLPPGEAARFHTRSGLLTAEKQGAWIELNFPVTPEEAIAAPPGLAEALGGTPRYVGQSRFDYLVEFESEEAVRKLQPDFSRLKAIPCTRGFIATSRSAAEDSDFVSRFFAPAAGIDEDPVTGSAHCCLAAFWSGRLNKKEFMARQISRRGGVLRVRLNGDRVLLGGQAVTVVRGELLA